jgi:hypothetical protein
MQHVSKQIAETPSMATVSVEPVSGLFEVVRKNYVLKKNPFFNLLPDSKHLTDCPNSPKNLVLRDTLTGNVWNVNCNAYKCSFCGPRKALKLKKALEKFLLNWKYIRLFTFTLTSRFNITPKLHYKILCECWRRFNTEIRRRRNFSKVQQNFSYIRVTEPHKSGYNHLHCFFSCYFEVSAIYPIWNEICESVLNFYNIPQQYEENQKRENLFSIRSKNKYFGWIDAKGNFDADRGSYYVSKYVMKCSKSFEAKQKKYTKSYDIKLFPKQIGPSHFQLLNLRDKVHEYYHRGTLENYFSRLSLCTTSQENEKLPPDYSELEIYDGDTGNFPVDECFIYSGNSPNSHLDDMNRKMSEIFKYFSDCSFIEYGKKEVFIDNIESNPYEPDREIPF